MGRLLKVGGLVALATILAILPTWLPSEAKQVWPTPRPVPTLAPAPTRVPARGTVAALPVCGPTTQLYLGDPAAYVLSLDDMPTGYYPDVERTSPETNELLISVAPDPEQRRAELEAWGRRGGYAAAFRTNSFLAANYVVSSVGIYETAEGAHQAFWDRDSREIQAGRLPVSMPSYCDEAKAYTWTYQESATSPIWTWYSVKFRKGNVSAGVGVVSRNFGDALEFTGLMQPKIR